MHEGRIVLESVMEMVDDPSLGALLSVGAEPMIGAVVAQLQQRGIAGASIRIGAWE